MKQINEIRSTWEESEILPSMKASGDEIQRFEEKYGFIIPSDLKSYFLLLNGTNDSYDNNLFRFYSLDHFLPVREALDNWRGTPNYRQIVNTLKNPEECFVFSDYSFHLFVYAIRLNKFTLDDNQIYIIQGSNYEVIATSFTQFLSFYLEDDSILASL